MDELSQSALYESRSSIKSFSVDQEENKESNLININSLPSEGMKESSGNDNQISIREPQPLVRSSAI